MMAQHHRRWRRGGRQRLPEHPPRERVEYELPAEELPGPGLLAQTITSKYGYQLSPYRLEGIFARHGVELSRAALCGRMAKCAELLIPLFNVAACAGTGAGRPPALQDHGPPDPSTPGAPSHGY
jgi:transposase